MFNLFSVVGTTAVGKTSFALEAARKILQTKDQYQKVDLISADSRQVYQGLEVISGADIPAGFIKRKIGQNKNLDYPYYVNDNLRLHGVSILQPDEDWSVGQFHRLVWQVSELATAEKSLVIVVGGTGLYHEQILNFDPALQIGPNARVRKKAERISVKALQEWAFRVNPARFKEMNRSDRYNPRRLIRVIEIGLAEPPKNLRPDLAKETRQIYLGLRQDMFEIEQKIEKRVKQRFEKGALAEVEKLKTEFMEKDNQALPALSALGIESLESYLSGKIDQEKALELWTLHELQYARKQMAWWEGKPIKWFLVEKPGWKRKAFAYILDSC